MLINGELHYGWFGAFNFDKDAPKDVVFYEFGVKEEDGFSGMAVGHDENHEVHPQLNPSSSEVTLGDLKRIVNENNEGSEFSLEDGGVGLKSHGSGGSDFSVDEGEVVTRWVSELRGRIGVVNRITSLYGKDKIDELLKHKALYWNKGKARYALSDYRLQLPATALVMRASGKNVPNKVDLVKYKKENGKRISLVEHTSKKVSKKNEVGIIPTNSATAQNAFGATLENNPSLKAQTAGRRSGVNLPDGVKIVNINDIELHFDDGGVMEANWSLDGTNFCIIGEGSEIFREYEEAGLVYVDKEDGYYSIITAFPIENLNKKPSGKRIPFVERTLRITPKPQGKHVSLPTSSATGQSALYTGTDNQAVSVGATAGGGSGVSLPDGVKIVNINDIELHFDDDGVMEANWSLDGTNFCIIGEGSEIFREYEEAGLVYVDKVDGKKK